MNNDWLFSLNCFLRLLPDLSEHPGITPATAETWALFQLITRVRNVYGAELLGPVVISMCRSASDVLSVLLLARWTGCDDGLQIVPLFETIEDLQAASPIFENLFTLANLSRAPQQMCECANGHDRIFRQQ